MKYITVFDGSKLQNSPSLAVLLDISSNVSNIAESSPEMR